MEQTLTVNGVPYKVVMLLGHGKGGYSYLAEKDSRQYVIKQIHHEPCSYYTFGNKIESEWNDYRRLTDAQIPIPKLLEIDWEQERILKEYIPGPTIYTLVKADLVKPVYFDQVRHMAWQAQQAGLNLDYFPTNFVVCNDRLYYVDYECNLYDPKWPISSRSHVCPPHFVGEDAQVIHSIVTDGCEIYGKVENSVLSPEVKVGKGASVYYSVLMPGAVIEEGAVVEYAIIGENTVVRAGAHVGSAPDGSERYSMMPEEFGKIQQQCRDNGASLLGGCCGTTPEHIAGLAFIR